MKFKVENFYADGRPIEDLSKVEVPVDLQRDVLNLIQMDKEESA